MNYYDDFKDWLNKVRFSRNVCLLMPMEACMGCPVVVKNGAEYIIPFFKVASTQCTDILSPPFAYVRINYPSARILTYNNLRTLPDWNDIDWNATVNRGNNDTIASKIEEYYKKLCDCSCLLQNEEYYDKLLLDSLCYENSNLHLLIVWYKKLIGEAKKYR